MTSAIAVQSAKRTAELKDLQDAVGITSVKLRNHTERSFYTIKAKKFVLDTTLHAKDANMTHPADLPHHPYYAQVMSKEITVRKVEGIPNKERLGYVSPGLLFMRELITLFVITIRL